LVGLRSLDIRENGRGYVDDVEVVQTLLSQSRGLGTSWESAVQYGFCSDPLSSTVDISKAAMLMRRVTR